MFNSILGTETVKLFTRLCNLQCLMHEFQLLFHDVTTSHPSLSFQALQFALLGEKKLY